MSTDFVLLILYVLLALVVSSICSVFEAVLLSITPSYLAAQEKNGSATGTRLRGLKDDIDRPLAAILSLNTVAHTVGAAGAGAQAARVFEGDMAVGIFSGVLTLLILLVSEIIPKSLGAAHWKRLAPPVAALLIPMIWSMYPLVLLARGVTGFLSKDKDAGAVSREEISALSELGAKRGVFETGESRILKNMFRLPSLRAKDVMTPRTVVFALHKESKVRDVVESEESLRFSRIPLYEESLDQIVGYVLRGDVLLRAARAELDLPISELAREIKVVPKNVRLSTLFDLLLKDQTHIALVVDEYGGTEGIVTMEDLVETLVGMEIVDEVDAVQDMQELAREQWRKRAARLGIQEAKPRSESRDDAPAEGEAPGETEPSEA